MKLLRVLIPTKVPDDRTKRPAAATRLRVPATRHPGLLILRRTRGHTPRPAATQRLVAATPHQVAVTPRQAEATRLQATVQAAVAARAAPAVATADLVAVARRPTVAEVTDRP